MTVIEISRKELGVKESPPNSNKVKYNTWYYGREVSGASYPWCMAFVQWCYAQAGLKLPYKTASCSALLNWYKKNKPSAIVTEPKAGDVVIYNFGHTGILESADRTTVTVIEGNTAVGNDANGGMVMRRKRKKSLVTAYIRPFEVEGIKPKEEVKEEEINMTKDELKALIAENVKAAIAEVFKPVTVYKTLADVPSYWRDEAARLLSLGVVNGGDDNDPEAINIDADTLRAVIIGMRYADIVARK